MKYRQALVFSYQRFENALISIISIGSLTRFTPILNFPIFFAITGSRWNFLILFQKQFTKRDFFGENPFFFIQRRVLNNYLQRLLKSFGSRIISNTTCGIHALCLNALMVTSGNLLRYTNSFQINTILQHRPAFLSSSTCLQNATQNSTASSQRCSLFGSLK